MTTGTSAAISTIIENLRTRGWSEATGFLPDVLLRRLRSSAFVRDDRGEFRQAGIGRQDTMRVDAQVRGDRIFWLGGDPSAEESELLRHLENLRTELARALFMPLKEIETHFAIYPPGGFYQKHKDQFSGSGARQVSFVFYLNEGWLREDGGLLRIFKEGSDDVLEAEIVPCIGTGVIFLSASIFHEVTTALRQRASLTGWLLT